MPGVPWSSNQDADPRGTQACHGNGHSGADEGARKTNLEVGGSVMKTTLNGIISDIANKDYHAHPALSSSGLKHLAKSPAHYQDYRANPPEQSKEMMIGSAVHAAFLENGFQNGMILKAPGSTRATKLYKEFADANPNGILLLEDEYAQVEKITETLAKHPTVSALMKNGKAEQSIFWKDPETGIDCKCRPDFLTDDGVIIDLKTTQDASPEGFQSSIGKFKYHWQTAWYLDGVSIALGKQLENFVHIAVEKEAPYGIGIYVLDNGSIEKARTDISKLKARFAECLHTGDWPGISSAIQNISIPSYEFYKEIAS
jgi:hypothetical protein